MTEKELVRAAQRGDDSAFEELVRTYEKRVYHLALRMCGNVDDAYEVAQEAFLGAWKGTRFFRGDTSFSDFLPRQRRRGGSDGVSLDDEDTFLEVAAPAPSPHQQAERLELRDALARGLGALSPEHRQVLLLRELQGLTYEEIAAALELDLGTVKSRIARAREKLRKYLVASGNFSGYLPSNLAEKEG